MGRVKDTLDELFYKGVIFPRGDFRRREFYRFARSIGQFHDATQATEQLDVEKDRRFFGCGVCVVGCEPGAIKMKAVRPPEHIPAVPEEA